MRARLLDGDDPRRLARALGESGFPFAAALVQELASTPGALTVGPDRREAWHDRYTALASALLAEVEPHVLAGGRAAVLSQSDFTAGILLRPAMERHPGWTVGHDLGVTGGGNTEAFTGSSTPVITTVDYDMNLVAEELVELLLERLDDPAVPPRTVLVSSTVVRRTSL